MTASKAFFNSKQDWLSHTLEHASETLPKCHYNLPGGGTLVQLGTGILQINPPQNRQNTHQDAMIISAGIHGNETAPIEVLNQLVNELISGALQPACPALLILGNPQAMVTGKRFTDANLNRLFSGAHQRDEYRNTPEAERAQQLEQLCQTFAEQTQAQGLALSHYDLHTAIRSSQREKFALYSFVPGRQVPAKQCAFLLAAEVHTLLLQHKAGTTFASFSSSALNAESFTVELGQVKAFGQNDLSRFQGIHNALKQRLGGLPAHGSAATTDESAEMAIFQVVHEILNSGEAFQFHVPDDVANFTEYAPGTVIWEDSRQRYCVGEKPEAIVFPNRDVPVGQRAGLLVSRLAD